MKSSVWIFETSSPGLFVANDVSLLVTLCLCVYIGVGLWVMGGISTVLLSNLKSHKSK